MKLKNNIEEIMNDWAYWSRSGIFPSKPRCTLAEKGNSKTLSLDTKTLERINQAFSLLKNCFPNIAFVIEARYIRAIKNDEAVARKLDISARTVRMWRLSGQMFIQGYICSDLSFLS